MLSYSARRLATRLLPALAGSAQATSVGSCFDFDPRSGAAKQQHTSATEMASAAGLWQQWRGLAGRSSGGGSDSGAAAAAKLRQRRPVGRRSHALDPQPQLQSWLQQEHGLPEKEADMHARRLTTVFGSNGAAALASLPATFSWCRSHGLPGLRTAQLLGKMAEEQHGSVVSFADTVQHDWQLIDGYIRAHYQHQKQAGEHTRKHASLGSVFCSNLGAGKALTKPPGHVAAWVAAVGTHMSAAQIGALLATHPNIVIGKPATAVAAIKWADSELGVTDPGSFFRNGPTLLATDMATLQGKLDNLQQAAGLTAEQARQLAVSYQPLLQSSEERVQEATGWLAQRIPAAEQRWAAVQNGPQLLTKSAAHLQGNADVLQQLGWSRERVLAYIEAYPQPFAAVDLSWSDTAAKLLFLTRVLGVASVEQCIEQYGNYLSRGLDTMGARYMLAQRLKPSLLRYPDGSANLGWIINRSTLVPGVISLQDFRAHIAEWPHSEEGQRLLAGIRSGSIDRWPLPDPAVRSAKAAKGGAGTGPAAAAAPPKRR